jgi:hypothetical protein
VSQSDASLPISFEPAEGGFVVIGSSLEWLFGCNGVRFVTTGLN